MSRITVDNVSYLYNCMYFVQIFRVGKYVNWNRNDIVKYYGFTENRRITSFVL